MNNIAKKPTHIGQTQKFSRLIYTIFILHSSTSIILQFDGSYCYTHFSLMWADTARQTWEMEPLYLCGFNRLGFLSTYPWPG